MSNNTNFRIQSRRWYLNQLNIPKKKEELYLETMRKYETDWWESKDPATIVKFQLNEPLLLVPLIKLQNCLEAVLGHENLAKAGEISFGNKKLKDMAFEAIATKV